MTNVTIKKNIFNTKTNKQIYYIKYKKIYHQISKYKLKLNITNN